MFRLHRGTIPRHTLRPTSGAHTSSVSKCIASTTNYLKCQIMSATFHYTSLNPGSFLFSPSHRLPIVQSAIISSLRRPASYGDRCRLLPHCESRRHTPLPRCGAIDTHVLSTRVSWIGDCPTQTPTVDPRPHPRDWNLSIS